ncbi:MAG: TIGR01777 family oxidoreductase [Desulfobacteraceae bacterium]|nr:TIGR01777 family oxidoreductase [Desulfobacteraceae bacterium]
MKIFITGGTGFVGRYLGRRLSGSGHEILVLARSAASRSNDLSWATLVVGDPNKPGEWQRSVSSCDAVINLAGASIFTPWTETARENILRSRIQTTRNIVDALGAFVRARTLVNASAVGYYGSRLDDVVLSEISPPGSEFLSEVCLRWEDEASRAERVGARVVLCRFGIVLGRGGGALAKMVPAFRYFLGGVLGSGRQWLSWIHLEDLFRIIDLALRDTAVKGPVNCTAPGPVTNAEFAHTLARVLKRPIILPAVPAFVLRGLLGEFGDVVLKGQRVSPEKLLGSGFAFLFPELRKALEDLLK